MTPRPWIGPVIVIVLGALCIVGTAALHLDVTR